MASGTRRGRLVLLLFLCVGVASADLVTAASARSTTAVLVLHLRATRGPYGGVDAVGGRYAVAEVGDFGSGEYAIFDDQTQRWRSFSGGCPEEGPSGLVGGPWVYFDCGGFGELYNIPARRQEQFDCGQACADYGLAAATAIGSQWIEYDEDAFCDQRYDPCDNGFVYVRIPNGTNRTAALDATRYVDLNSPALIETLCRPLRPVYGGLVFFGRFGVGVNQTGLVVQRCGSTRQTELIRTTPHSNSTVAQGNTHAIFACNITTGRYTGLFIPSLRRFTFTLPHGAPSCGARLGDRELYAGPWQARFPTH